MSWKGVTRKNCNHLLAAHDKQRQIFEQAVAASDANLRVAVSKAEDATQQLMAGTERHRADAAALRQSLGELNAIIDERFEAFEEKRKEAASMLEEAASLAEGVAAGVGLWQHRRVANMQATSSVEGVAADIGLWQHRRVPNVQHNVVFERSQRHVVARSRS